MADVSAFRAHRFDLGRVGNLSDVVCPPYDVIDPSLQRNLYDRSPYNVIRLELTKDEPGDNDRVNRYTRAAAQLRDWLTADVIRQDTARSFYVYHQEFEVEGQRYTRRGFFARVRLEPFGQGRIYPHEETLAGPKADRLKLLQATGMQFSPIFGLYPDESCDVQDTLEQSIHRALPIEAVDHLGVVSRLWPVTDQHVISRVVGLMGPKPLFIADGHHRYETGLRYLQELEALGEPLRDDHPARFILMNLVGMNDPGLRILPTHRLVSGLKGLTAEQLRHRLAPHVIFEPVGQGAPAAAQAWQRIEEAGSQDALGFGTIADGVWQIGRFVDPNLMQQLATHHSPEWRSLGVAILHVAVLNHLLGGGVTCRYVHLLREVQDAAAAGDCDLAVFVPPAEMQHVERISQNLEKMPPKSTYFYPKILSGLLFYSLKHH
jgi:uncharacterized protein (DUF1015 family)